MRVLITGARGQVGQSLRERIPENWEAIFTDSNTLDITNEQSVNTMIQSFQPDVIINTAAYTNVDDAEKNSEMCFQVNAHGVGNLARAAKSVDARLIHISTDYVFDGATDTPYSVDDVPNPKGIYGQSKLGGELMALLHCPQTHIIRTSWVYSEYGNNFIPTIIKKLINHENVTITFNNLGAPTYAGDLADFILNQVMHPPVTKLTHFSGNEIINRLDLALLIAQQVNRDSNLVQLATTDASIRPLYSILKNSQPVQTQKISTLAQNIQKITLLQTQNF